MERHRPKIWEREPGGLVLVLVVTALAAGTPIREVRAQPAGPEQVAEVLEQARTLYEELQPLAQRIGDPSLIQRMQALRSQWQVARGHFQGRRYQVAGRLAQQNLDRMREIASALRRLSQRLPYYDRLAERNREILRLFQQTMGPRAPQEVQRRLTLSADMVERAERARGGGRVMEAFRLMEQADGMLRQMLRRMDRGGLTPEAVERELRETERQMERLQALPELSEGAADALERADALQDEARHHHAAGQFRQALSRTLTARSAVRLAQGLVGGGLTSEEVTRAISHAEEVMSTYSEAASSEAAGVADPWRQARRMLEQARERLEAGRLAPALEAAQSAAKLALTAARRAGLTPGGPPPPGPAA
ncbi:MAG: hypothetical protein R6W82_00040 [bacterium]